MKHTPAPWYPVNYAGYWIIQDKDVYDGIFDLLDVDKCILAEENAKLMAAAPDLLKSLDECAALIATQEGWGPALKRAKEAIEKATGLKWEEPA